MAEVPLTGSSLSEAEAGAILCRAWAEETGDALSPHVGAFILAIVWLENDAGKAIQAHNWGNISCPADYSGDHWVPPWVRDETHRLHGVPGIPQCFRAYPDDVTGARALVSLLRRRYAPALEAAALGDPRQASARLLEGGYCPDCPRAAHADSIAYWWDRFIDRQIIECPGYVQIGRAHSTVTPGYVREFLPANGAIAFAAIAAPAAVLALEHFALRPRFGERRADLRLVGSMAGAALSIFAIDAIAKG